MTVETAVVETLDTKISALIASDPRLQAIGNERLQRRIAKDMLAGDTYENAMAEAGQLFSQSDAIRKELGTTIERIQGETSKAFTDATYDLIQAAVDSIAKDNLPVGGISIFVNVNAELKNPDGTPQMDSKNNPMRGNKVEMTFNWAAKKAKSSGTNSTGVSDGRGRKEGDYIFGDEVFNSMSDYIAKKYGSEFDSKAITSRRFLEKKGYTIPEDAITDADGKKHFVVEMPTTPATA